MGYMGATIGPNSLNSVTSSQLTNFVYPSTDGGWRDIFRSNWKPFWFNQQWGGSQIGTEVYDSQTGVMYRFEAATQQIQADTVIAIGNLAAEYYASSGFKVSETINPNAIWVKLYKVGTANRSATFAIYSDNGSGAPSTLITNGTANTINLMQITSKSDGEWYRLTFPTPPSLVANTQYHIVATQSTTDASNYLAWIQTARSSYPGGLMNLLTSALVATSYTGYAACFMIEPPSTNQWLQASGQFDKKLVFMQGTPINQSKLLTQPASGYFDGKSGTILFRGSVPVSSTFHDIAWGLDHDRIVMYTNSSGYPCVSLYRSDRTIYTVTGTSSVISGNNDIGVAYRCVGDGADYLYLYVNGLSQGSPLTGQTFSMSEGWRDIASSMLGGGFSLAPTWTQDMQMSSLPSAQGWAWTGTGSESSCMTVLNGKLYQNANGYSTTLIGTYQKTTTLSNSTGWAVKCRVRVSSAINSTTFNASNVSGFCILIYDGTKTLYVSLQEYFMQSGSATSSGVDFTVQGDFKNKDNIVLICGKGSDYYVYLNNTLVIDGTGKLTATTSSNLIGFGDMSSVSSDNCDAVISYLKYSSNGMVIPNAANSGTLSEFANWSGNTIPVLVGLYNNGLPISIKKYCGVTKNYIDGRDSGYSKLTLRGVTLSPTTTSTSEATQMPEMEGFCVGGDLRGEFFASITNSTAAVANTAHTFIDGVSSPESFYYSTTSTGGIMNAGSSEVRRVLPLGLHKVNVKWGVGGGTATNNGQGRSLIVETKI